MKPFLAVAVLAVVIVLSVQIQPSDAELTGDGSPDNPYSGHVTELDSFAFYKVGTTFEAEVPGGMFSFITEGSGLQLERDGASIRLIGTLANPGLCRVEAIGDEGSYSEFIINIVSDTENNGDFDTIIGTYWEVAGLTVDNPIITGDSVLSDVSYELDDDGWYDFTIDWHGDRLDWYLDILGFLEQLPVLMEGSELQSSPLEVYNVDETNETIKFRVEMLSNYITLYPWTPTYFVSEGRIVDITFEFADLYEDFEAEIPDDPTREGYVFTGWYEDWDCTEPWGARTTYDWYELGSDLDLPVRYVYAGWEPDLGSEQFPYTGEATIPLQNGDEVWAEVGTSVHFDQDAGYDFTGYEGSGLSQEGFTLEGTLTTPGEYVIAYGNPGSGAYHLMFTLHVVGDIPLKFLSDPTDPLCATITYSKP